MCTVPGRTLRASACQEKIVQRKEPRLHSDGCQVLPGKESSPDCGEQKAVPRKNRAQLAEYNKAYRERNQARLKELRRLRREKNRDQLRESRKHYRERNRVHLKEAARLYRQNNLERCLRYEQQYRETHREQLREKGRHYRARLAEKKRTREKLKTLGPLRLTIPLTACRTQPSLETYLNNFCASLPSVERQKTEEKIKALGPLKLTIPLEDFMKTIPKTSENFSFCESFLDSYTLTDMDLGDAQVTDPPDLDPLTWRTFRFCRTY